MLPPSMVKCRFPETEAALEVELGPRVTLLVTSVVPPMVRSTLPVVEPELPPMKKVW